MRRDRTAPSSRKGASGIRLRRTVGGGQQRARRKLEGKSILLTHPRSGGTGTCGIGSRAEAAQRQSLYCYMATPWRSSSSNPARARLHRFSSLPVRGGAMDDGSTPSATRRYRQASHRYLQDSPRQHASRAFGFVSLPESQRRCAFGRRRRSMDSLTWIYRWDSRP